jgi:hypothetical protein
MEKTGEPNRSTSLAFIPAFMKPMVITPIQWMNRLRRCPRVGRLAFTSALAARGIVEKTQLLALLAKTPIEAELRERIRAYIEKDFQ